MPAAASEIGMQPQWRYLKKNKKRIEKEIVFHRLAGFTRGKHNYADVLLAAVI